MSHLMNSVNILYPCRNIVRGEHDIVSPKKVYSSIAKTIFYNNFYEMLNVFAIISS